MSAEAEGTPIAAADVGATLNEINAKLAEIGVRLDRMAEAVDDFDRRMESFDDFMEDLGPISHGALGIAQRKMGELEDEGILAFGGEVVQVGRTIATSFTPEDVRLLGDNVVGILETVRNLTQPEVLGVADRAAEAISRPGPDKPLGTLKLIKAMRDPDVRRGLTLLLGVLKEMGENGEAASAANTE